MESMFLPIAVFIGTFLIVLFIVFKMMASKSDVYTKTAIERIYSDAEGGTITAPAIGGGSSLPFSGIPLLGSGYALYQRARIAEAPATFVIFSIVSTLALIFICSKLLGSAGLLIGLLASAFVVHKFIARQARKQDDLFLNKFPDALDMIARSVRSGFPLNTALRIIAENMDPPISTEFKLLVDEITYGRSLPEALYRFADRVGLADVQFFAVVLTVQQETGGSLAEVMTNLSSIIRKRKQLRMKISALTSEGKATAMILGGLPILVLGAIQWTTPDYLEPLFTTTMGHWILGGAAFLIITCFVIVNKMIDIDI